MSLRSRCPLLATLSLLAVIALALWWLSPGLVRLLVFFRPGTEGETAGEPRDVSEAQAHVEAARSALGLQDTRAATRTREERSDRGGSWVVQRERWTLPTGTSAEEMAQRLRSLVSAQDPEVEVYVVQGEAGEVQVRLYAGARLAVVVDLSPSLTPWPILAPAQHPQVALVLTGIDLDPYSARRLMDAGLPLTLALSPYSPFTLRLSRDALSTHTEVLAWAEPDATPSEALEGVPWATGLMIACQPLGEPEAEARLLAAADVYVLDATEGGLDTRWLAALDDAHVPLRRPLGFDPGSPDASQRRLRHTAAQRGGAIMSLPVGAGSAALVAPQEAASRGYRAALTAEVVAATPR